MAASTLRARRRWGVALLTSASVLWAGSALAKPIAPGLFCDTYPDAPACFGGAPACTQCHSYSQPPPALNPFGSEVKGALVAYASTPFSDQAFMDHLSDALADVEASDADGDGFDNREEIEGGTAPGNPASLPGSAVCPTPEQLAELDYQICVFDPKFALRRIGLDFCGISPTFAEMEALEEAAPDAQMQRLHDKLSECLESEHYRGFGGVLWQMASRKIRPVGGLVGFADFHADYDYFVYTQIDDHDVRDVLVGQYFVTRVETESGDGVVTTYEPTDQREGQPMQPERRAGLLTSAWPLFYNTMFTALPRGTAASAYRAFLNLDIAASEGLEFPIAGEPVDYDNKGVKNPTCAACHSTLDPLSYPFATYNGLQGDGQIGVFQYDKDRIAKYFAQQYPAMLNMPESGYLFGEPVADLLEWASVAANSEQFFIATTEDYWKLLMGAEPSSEDAATYAEFTDLWQGLMDDEQHSAERMLHALIETEAYGAP